MTIEGLQGVIGYLARGLEATGVAIIVIGVLYFIIRFFKSAAAKDPDSYHGLKVGLGKTILLGLEVLIAADIINTVITDLNLWQVAALGVIVLIRTFLSFSLQIEIDGRLPWRRGS